MIEGPPAKKADLTINISDDDFVALSLNKLNPQQAFMQGKIKLKGASELTHVEGMRRPRDVVMYACVISMPAQRPRRQSAH